MTNHRFRLPALMAALCLVAAACGGGDDDSAAEETTTTAATDTTVDDGAAHGEDEPLLESRDLDGVVQYANFEFEMDDIEVPEPEEVPGGMPGRSFTVNMTVTNLDDRTTTPGTEVAVQWDDENDNVVQVRGQNGFREVPGNSSSSGSVQFLIDPDDVRTWDENSARLVFGQSGSAQAVVPIGDDVELVSRLPVEQDISGTFDVNGFTFEVEYGVVRWNNIGDRSQVEEDTAILELWGPMENGTDSQECIGSRSRRIEPTIELLDGSSRTLLGSNVNCLRGGENERQAVVAFEIDDPYGGDYEVTLSGGGDDGTSTLTITLVEGEGTASDDRDVADSDADLDEDDASDDES